MQICCSSVADLLQLCCTHTQCVLILLYTCCNRAARELRAINQPQGLSCNRAATELQQSCNRAATELRAINQPQALWLKQSTSDSALLCCCSYVAALLKQSTSDSALLCYTLMPTPAVALLSCFTALLSCFTLVLYTRAYTSSSAPTNPLNSALIQP